MTYLHSPDGTLMPADRIDRRAMLIAVLAAVGTSRRGWAQSESMPTVAYLGPESPRQFASRLRAFHEGLAEAGYVEGQNVRFEYRWAQGLYGRMPELAAELARLGASVLVATGGAQSALAAKAAVNTPTPIVFEMGGDPVQLGVVDSLSRPGSTITGVSSLSVEVSRKRLEFMRELRPGAKALVVAVNPNSPTARSQLENLQSAASALGVDLQVFEVRDEAQLEPMFVAAATLRDGAVVFTSDPYFAFRSELIAELAARHRVPAVTQSRDFPAAGGLMSYGGDFMQSHRRAGLYTGRILQGTKPWDLPVQLVTKVEFVFNVRAARQLGLDVAPTLLSGADEVIE